MATTDFVVKNGLVVTEEAQILGTTDATSATDTAAAVYTAGGIAVAKKAFVGTDLAVGGATTLTGDIAVNGGDITTNQATFNLVNATATTVNFAGAGTDIQIGSATGTTNVNNNLDVDGDVNIDGGDLTASTTTFNLVNTTATTVNAFGDAASLTLGATTGTTTVRTPTVTLSNATTVNVNGASPTFASTSTGTLTLFNTNLTTATAFGAATTVNIGNATAAQTINIGNASTGGSTYNFATAPTATGNTKTVNIGTAGASGSTTNVNIGSSIAGTTTINSATVAGAVTTQNLFNTLATTVNAFGAAGTVNIGANSGTITIGNPTLVGTQATQNVYNTTATTVNFAGAATAVNIGAATGTTTINNPELRIGGSNTGNFISFRGTTGDGPGSFNHTYIGERIHAATEASELLIFKGNDPLAGSGPDRVRIFAGEFRVDTYTSAISDTFENTGASASAINRMLITSNGQVTLGANIASTTTATGTLLVTGGVGVSGAVFAGTLNSTVASGTAPFTVASTTKVTNLNADLLDGLDVHTGTNNEVNKIVRTDSNGYIQAGWINTISGDHGTTAIDRVYASNDGYIRYYTPTNFRTVLNVPTRTGGDASGTWGINITGNAASATILETTRTINGSGFNGSANIDTTEWYHSDRDFPNGTLITTNINYAVSSGDPFVLEIRGNSYGNIVPLDLIYQGYIYSDTIINHGGISNGFNISGLVAINNGGNLCFWFPSQGYWNGYNVKVYAAYATRAVNRVTSITGVAKPTTAKEVALSANIRQSLHSSNFISYAPSLTGGGASGTWGINITGNAGTATTLQTARNINGVSFNGSTDITVADATKLPLAGGTLTGRLISRQAAVSLATGNSSQLEINNAANGACNISFHREGDYGAHFGLDTDNVFSTLGWSAGAGYTAMRVGNFTANGTIVSVGNVTAPTFIGALSGNATTATALTSTQTNWLSNGVGGNVVGLLGWKNYGGSHVIFDASAGTSPSGGAVNNTNSQIAWGGTYPTLMGWNGANTYGVRVDSARVADNGGVTSVSATSPIVASPTTGAVALSHAASGVAAGTYNSVTVNATGHVTAGSNVTVAETDTLASVTGRGASTSTMSSFNGGGRFLAPNDEFFSFTNVDSDSTHYTSRAGRILTSNGVSWVADGKDAVIAITRNSAGTTRGQSIGLTLHNENNTTNAYSPAITFTATSNSGGYNSMYAAIMGKKTGQNLGVDSNWNKGELHFYAVGDAYVADTPNMVITGTAIGMNTASPAARLHVVASAVGGIGSVPAGTTSILDSSSNNYLLFRNSADNGTYSGIAMQDNNVGGYVVFGNAGGGGDQLYVAGYGGGNLQAGTTDSINPAARTTYLTWSANGVGITSGSLTLNNNRLYFAAVNDNNHALNYPGGTFNGQTNGTQFRWYNYLNLFSTSGNISVMHLNDSGNVGVGLDNPSYKLHVNGSFAATTKSFVIDHPTKSGMKLRYGSLEGPENGVYVRGKLVGTDVIELPDYWTGLVDADSITVNLTAAAAGQQLYVDRIKNNCVYIVNETGKPVNCFYTVYGERKDVDKLVVEID